MTLAGTQATRHDAELQSLRQELLELRSQVVADAARYAGALEELDPSYRQSATNLLHYLTLRRRDLRPLQHKLSARGLSSLGRAEPHVLATLDAVLDVLHRLLGMPEHPASSEAQGIAFGRGQALLREHARGLLGEAREGRDVRIMVTMPSEAADDPSLIRDLLLQGMECMRINLAHDGPEAMLRMVAHLRQAERDTGRTCKVVMDLAGPKLRTGPVEPPPAVVHIKPARDGMGRVTAPAKVWLSAETAAGAQPAGADAVLPVPARWLHQLSPGDRITLTDARDAQRELLVSEVTPAGVWTQSPKAMYIVTGAVLSHPNAGQAKVGELKPREGFITLAKDDTLLLTRTLEPGRDALRDAAGKVIQPASIGCTMPEVFLDVRPGEPIWFDDGKIGGIIEHVAHDQLRIRITHARPAGEKLRADKGVNLPDSRLQFSALTPSDLQDLPLVAQHADVIELSFANSASDVLDLQRELSQLGDRRPAIVLKIETRRGFENLPELLLAAMRWPCCGIMIARGDLAVECGFERLAEVQEEILWVCEAAHVPVIWATQVLEKLAKEGQPSRAEITDAAMGHRAECVMLNKGPHVLAAVRVLDDILRRMQSHQDKKRAMLRELRVARTLEAGK